MEPRIVTHSQFRVVGLQISTSPMSPDIPALWPKFVARIAEVQEILEPHVSYGVMDRVPGKGQSFNYLAAVSVSSTVPAAPDGMTSLLIPSGRYAAFEFPLSEIAPAFDFILGRWLPASAFSMLDSPFFERYSETFDPTDSKSRIEVHIPLRPRGGDA